MIVEYKFRTDKTGTQGWFQCEDKKIKKIIRNRAFREQASWLNVRAKGTKDMWTKQSGWCVPTD